ncbi:MAG: 3'-5' exonuclease [Patescibacteria group bacterium]
MIVLDVEATGLNPRADSIVSLGALDVANPENRFYGECQIWDGAHVHEEALAINGFTDQGVRDTAKKTEAELITAFIAWATTDISERTLAAQNVSFDLEFVQEACKRAGIECPFGKRTIDTHTLVWLHMIEHGKEPPLHNNHSAISLDYALSYCGLPSEPAPHNALTGALCHAEVISRIAYTKKLLPEFDAFPLPF